MDLLCKETVLSSVSGSGTPPEVQNRQNRSGSSKERPVRRALADPALLKDRVLDNLLKAEEHHGLVSSYFITFQVEITPHMRRIVADWMLEVCEEQTCQEEVFTLAISYMDRFLSTCCISRNQLQLLGSACLLLASKLREPSSKGLSAYTLVYYTDNSITITDLCKWELLVLSKLKWDMAVVIPHDFLSLLMWKLDLDKLVEPEIVVRHAQTFIALAAKDYNFTIYSSSTLAAASVAAALQGLEWEVRSGETLEGLLDRLHDIIKVEQDYLHACLGQIEQMIHRAIEERNCDPNGRVGAGEQEGTKWTQPHNTPEKMLNKAETPTDVRNVHF